MSLALRSKQEDGGMNKMISLRARCLGRSERSGKRRNQRSERSGKRHNHLNWVATNEPWSESGLHFSLIPFPHHPHQYLGLNIGFIATLWTSSPLFAYYSSCQDPPQSTAKEEPSSLCEGSHPSPSQSLEHSECLLNGLFENHGFLFNS